MSPGFTMLVSTLNNHLKEHSVQASLTSPFLKHLNPIRSTSRTSSLKIRQQTENSVVGSYYLFYWQYWQSRASTVYFCKRRTNLPPIIPTVFNVLRLKVASQTKTLPHLQTMQFQTKVTLPQHNKSVFISVTVCLNKIFSMEVRISLFAGNTPVCIGKQNQLQLQYQ